MSDTITTADVSEATQPAQSHKSAGQVYYEEVEALKATGLSNADAIRALSDKLDGQSISSIRGAIYQYKKRLEGGASSNSGRSRAKAVCVDDLVGQAKASLEEALRMIDTEVEQARTAVETATAHYEQVQAAVKQRKSDIEKKLKALT